MMDKNETFINYKSVQLLNPELFCPEFRRDLCLILVLVLELEL